MVMRRFRGVFPPLELRTHLGVDPMVPMLLVAAVIGCAASLAVEGFKEAMSLIIHIYSAHAALVDAAIALPWWERAAIPPFAATAGGLLMWAGQRWVTRATGPEYMEAVRVGDGRLPLAPNLVRTASSLLAVSGGITIGREGTMIQFAAVVASIVGRFGRVDIARQRLITACGVASGFASAYHAPIAGTLFVAEIILGGLRLREVSAVLVAAVIGELVTQSLFASGPLYLTHVVPEVNFIDLLDASLLGLLAGVAGPGFLWLLDSSRSYYQSLLGSVPLRMGFAGGLIGLLSILSPQVWGNGYSLIQSLLVNQWTVSSALLIFALRLIGVTAASAAGIPGGVLTPTLALGGYMGLIVAHLFLLPAASHSQTLWILVGMGCLLASTTHAPAMSAIMVFELSHNYNVVMAAMPACVIASVIGSLLRHRSVYSEALGLKAGEHTPELTTAEMRSAPEETINDSSPPK